MGGSTVLGPAWYCSRQHAEGIPYLAKVVNGVLLIQEGIDSKLAMMVEVAIHSTRDPIQRIKINSGGGQEKPKDQISAALADLGAIPIEVPPGTICYSACVAILVHAKGSIDIAPSATLMFHSSATRIGLSGSGFCGCLNKVSVWLSSFTTPESQRRVMLPWAEALSPKLPLLFGMCAVYPLDSANGMFLKGSELSGLKEGQIRAEDLVSRCPAA